MLLFYSLAYTAAITTDNAPDNMVALSRKAVDLVSLLTDMTVIDMNVYEDQVHILVNNITHELGDKFDILMGRLANKAHISMISDTLNMNWPMQPMKISNHSASERNVPFHNSVEHSNSKRSGGGGFRRARSYSNKNCRDRVLADDTLRSGECFPIQDDSAKSTSIENSGAYSMHVGLYSGKECAWHFKVGYFWLKKHTTTCYDEVTGRHAVWWDWPGRNSP